MDDASGEMPFDVVVATDPDGSRDSNGLNYPGVSFDGATKSPQIAAEYISPMTDSFETSPLGLTWRRKQQINVFCFFFCLVEQLQSPGNHLEIVQMPGPQGHRLLSVVSILEDQGSISASPAQAWGLARGRAQSKE